MATSLKGPFRPGKPLDSPAPNPSSVSAICSSGTPEATIPIPARTVPQQQALGQGSEDCRTEPVAAQGFQEWQGPAQGRRVRHRPADSSQTAPNVASDRPGRVASSPMTSRTAPVPSVACRRSGVGVQGRVPPPSRQTRTPSAVCSRCQPTCLLRRSLCRIKRRQALYGGLRFGTMPCHLQPSRHCGPGQRDQLRHSAMQGNPVWHSEPDTRQHSRQDGDPSLGRGNRPQRHRLRTTLQVFARDGLEGLCASGSKRVATSMQAMLRPAADSVRVCDLRASASAAESAAGTSAIPAPTPGPSAPATGVAPTSSTSPRTSASRQQ